MQYLEILSVYRYRIIELMLVVLVGIFFCMVILFLDLGVFEDQDQILCLDVFFSCIRIMGYGGKECLDMLVYCFFCGWECVFCFLKGQLWFIVLLCEEV